MDAPGAKVVPSSMVRSSKKVRMLVQGPVSGVTVTVGARVGVNTAGKGVGVGRTCVGGMAVGGRKGVGAGWGEQATAKRKLERKSKIERGKRRSLFI